MTEEILKQRSTQWRRKRLGVVTASRFHDVLTKPREKGAEWSKTAESYLLEKLAELITCQPSDNFTSAPTRWGTEWEAEAFERAIPVIEERFGAKLERPEGEFAFIEHPTESHVGCSPDGIIGDDGLLEVKAPWNPVNHLRTIRSGEMPEGHNAQVQGSLFITGRMWYAFCSFDPRVKASGIDPLFVCKVMRDERYIQQELAPKVLKFRDMLLEEYNKMAAKPIF
jgi:hypothetical protein